MVSEAAQRLNDAGIHPKERASRLDLRDEIIFTIDSADSKDLDDAVSIQKTKDGWELGVHIADVSYYVHPQSPLDNEAYARGTSIYYADQVIPMLPKAPVSYTHLVFHHQRRAQEGKRRRHLPRGR